jgi:hypothetical protein
MAFQLSSAAFGEGDTIPVRHTCEGDDTSTPLTWSGAPDGTRSFVLIMDDPDAPRGTFTHWVLADLPASLDNLPEGAFQGVPCANDFGRTGYGGPCPPRGHGPHRYYFRLYALDVEALGVHHNATRAQVEKAMAGHVLDQAQTMGRFERL